MKRQVTVLVSSLMMFVACSKKNTETSVKSRAEPETSSKQIIHSASVEYSFKDTKGTIYASNIDLSSTATRAADNQFKGNRCFKKIQNHGSTDGSVRFLLDLSCESPSVLKPLHISEIVRAMNQALAQENITYDFSLRVTESGQMGLSCVELFQKLGHFANPQFSCTSSKAGR